MKDPKKCSIRDGPVRFMPLFPPQRKTNRLMRRCSTPCSRPFNPTSICSGFHSTIFKLDLHRNSALQCNALPNVEPFSDASVPAAARRQFFSPQREPGVENYNTAKRAGGTTCQ